MQSSSVVVSLPSFPQDMPINANSLINSQPNAPQPTYRALHFLSLFMHSLPKMEIMPPYLLSVPLLSTSPSGKAEKKST